MFLGHFAVGLAGKKLVPRVSLGTLFLSVQLVDLLWPTFLLLGLEHVRIDPVSTRMTPLDFYDYPLTHSLVAMLAWGALFGLGYFATRRGKREALVLGLGVVSHWLLDLLVHRPDLPIWPGGPLFGLGVWNSAPGTIALEVGTFAIGTFWYLKATEAADRTGTFALWGLIAFLMLIWLGNLAGEPPPNVDAIAWVGQAQWLLVLWAYWVDRHRVTRQ